jgi:hypothetical protein
VELSEIRQRVENDDGAVNYTTSIVANGQTYSPMQERNQQQQKKILTDLNLNFLGRYSCRGISARTNDSTELTVYIPRRRIS